MWDLPHLVLLQKARNALRDGRLDEAYAIVTDTKVRDYRQCQVLLEKLVDPLLQRAAAHLDAGRTEDALADVERAQTAGGNRPLVAELRENVLAAVRKERRRKHEARQALVSVQGHLEAGRIEEGALRLEDTAISEGEAAQLGRRLERQRRAAEEARAQAAKHLGEGELEAAIRAVTELMAVAREEPASRELLVAAARQADAEIAKVFKLGQLERAASLIRQLDGLDAPGPERAHWREALLLAERSAQAVAHGDWPRARICLRRLKAAVPSAAWVSQAQKSVDRVEEASSDLQSGPLGHFVSTFRNGRGLPQSDAQTMEQTPEREPLYPASPDREGARPVRSARRAKDERFLLWVEGVGTFLLLGAERTTVGRAGSSARPDVALSADIDGIHAEFLRVDHDYFLIPHGPTSVGGRQVERHLLADGDEVRLGKRSNLTFRLPSKLSPTAVLELGPGLRLEGDVRKIILLDGPLIFGSGAGCHVELKEGNGRVILSATKGGFRCRAPEPVVVDGRPSDLETTVPPGAHVEAGPLTFTLTPAVPGGEEG